MSYGSPNIVIVPTVVFTNPQNHTGPSETSARTSNNISNLITVPITSVLSEHSLETNQKAPRTLESAKLFENSIVPISKSLEMSESGEANKQMASLQKCNENRESVLKNTNKINITKPPEVPQVITTPTNKHLNIEDCKHSNKKSSSKPLQQDVNKHLSSGDCKSVKKTCTSWASSYLQSIGQCTKPVKLTTSSSKNKLMENVESTPEGIKINLLSHSKAKNPRPPPPTAQSAPNNTYKPQKFTKVYPTEVSDIKKIISTTSAISTDRIKPKIQHEPDIRHLKTTPKSSTTTNAKIRTYTKPCLVQASVTNKSSILDTATVKYNSNKQSEPDLTHIKSFQSTPNSSSKSCMDIRPTQKSNTNTNNSSNRLIITNGKKVCLEPSNSPPQLTPFSTPVTNFTHHMDTKTLSNETFVANLSHRSNQAVGSSLEHSQLLTATSHKKRISHYLTNTSLRSSMDTKTWLSQTSEFLNSVKSIKKPTKYELPLKPSSLSSDKKVTPIHIENRESKTKTGKEKCKESTNKTKLDINKSETSCKETRDTEFFKVKEIMKTVHSKVKNQNTKTDHIKTSEPLITSKNTKESKEKESSTRLHKIAKDKSKTINLTSSKVKKNKKEIIEKDHKPNKDDKQVKVVKKSLSHPKNEKSIESKTKKRKQSSSPDISRKRIRRDSGTESSNKNSTSKKISKFNITEPTEKSMSHHFEKAKSTPSKTKLTNSHISENPRRKRIRRITEFSENKHIHHDSEDKSSDFSDDMTKISPIKSVVQVPEKIQGKHPRIQAPVKLDNHGHDDTDFDLRSKLSRIKHKSCSKRSKLHYDVQTKDKMPPRENLVITVDRNDEKEITKSSTGTSKPQTKTKKYKKIQLIINIKCKKQGSSSDETSSDDNDSNDDDNGNYAQRNLDVSFLDDFNIDEIVNSLKHSQDNKQTILTNKTENDKQPTPPSNKFVQPIFIKREIKTEYIENETHSDIICNDRNDVPQSGVENSNNDMVETESTTNSTLNKKDSENLSIDFIKNIKQEICCDNIGNTNENEITQIPLEASALEADNIQTDQSTDSIIEKDVFRTEMLYSESEIKREVCETEDGKNENHEDNKVEIKDVIKKGGDISETVFITHNKPFDENAVAKSKNTPDGDKCLDEKPEEEIINVIKTSSTDANIDKSIMTEETEATLTTEDHNKIDTPNNQEVNIDKNIVTESIHTKSNAECSDDKLTKPLNKIAEEIENKNAKLLKNNNHFTKNDKHLAQAIEYRLFEYLNKDMTVTALIHNGRYSKIFKCEDTNGDNYAVKKIMKDYHRYLIGIQQEKMLKQLQTDIPKEKLNIVYLFNGFEVAKNWCFLMEYYPTNLEQVLEGPPFFIDHVQELARQLVAAVVVLRNNDIVHSDIKPSHILLNNTKKRLKLCGFDDAHTAGCINPLPNIGTVHYRAPEIILGYSAGFSIDVWSTALVLYEMATGMKLFQGFHNNGVLYRQFCLFGNLPMDILVMSPYAPMYFRNGVFMKRIGYKRKNAVPIHNFFGTKRPFGLLFHTYNKIWSKDRLTQQRSQDLAKVASMTRLLTQMMVVDPRRRLSIEFVFADPFIYEKCD